jgi:adenosylcobinamide-GDP ribazoletransferase
MEWAFLAFQFLTIIPIRMKIERDISEKDIARSAMFFPLAGAFQGLILSLSCLILNLFFSSSLTGGIIIFIYVLLNGGFHLDGLSDTCDALSVKSTGNEAYDRGQRLKVMGDSATGAIGATAICLAILLKYLFIKELFVAGRQFNPYFILFLMPIFSKWAMVLSMRLGKSARPDGLGSIFIQYGKTINLVFSTIFTIFLSFFPYFLFLMITSQFVNTPPGSHVWALSLFCIVEMAILCVLCHFLIRWFTKKFGGLTGDNFGAIHEVSEFIFLMIALLWR